MDKEKFNSLIENFANTADEKFIYQDNIGNSLILCRYRVEEYLEVSNFMVGDVLSDLHERNLSIPVIEIYDIYIDEKDRNKGNAKHMIKTLADTFKDTIILIRAGISNKEYKEFPSIQDCGKIINNLIDLYEHIEFIGINDELCKLESQYAMMYKNKVGLDYYNLLTGTRE